VRARRAFEAVVEQIVDLIRAGDLHTGDRLPGERELAELLGVSRPTLREAIRTFVDAGVIAIRRGPGGGMVVATDLLPPALLAERRELRLSEVSAVLEARRVLEPGVAQLAAVHATPEDFDAMEHTLDLQLQHAHDWERLLQLDTRFHLDMARASHNPTLVGLVKPLFRKLEVARDMALRGPHVAAWTLDIHRRTIDALREGDPATIAIVMDEHLRTAEDAWAEETGAASRRVIPPGLRALV
jgi:GntR family transcriptional regulator, transcriptional repressor for pyruvate dehydrogenase complex